MLTKECQTTTNLLLENSNVRLIVAENAKLKQLYTPKSHIEHVWREYIRDTMGEIINSKNDYEVECYIVKSGKLEKIKKLENTKLPGSEIVEKFWETIKNVSGVKFKITQTDGTVNSYIIVR